MKKLKLCDDASPTKLTEPGFVQEFEPGQTHEVPKSVFEDYKDGSLFEPADSQVQEEALTEMEAHLDELTVSEVEDYIDSTIEDNQLGEYEGPEPFLDAVEDAERNVRNRSGVLSYVDEKRENLKSTEDES